IQSRISNLESGGVKGTGEVMNLDNVPRIDEMEVNCNYKTKFGSEEFARQLKDQEKGMNALNIYMNTSKIGSDLMVKVEQ
ncbi:hypothetical protein OCD71_27570, partial [Bacillus wiedmannii]|nr:hypothetical protein [Bacillus wiedmannii]